MSQYTKVHDRLREVRGKASEHLCRECGGQAEQWCYLHNGDPEFLDVTGTPFSQDIEACYAPMCRSCHRKFDAGLDNGRLRASLQASVVAMRSRKTSQI